MFLHPIFTLQEEISSVEPPLSHSRLTTKKKKNNLRGFSVTRILWMCFMEQGHNLQQHLLCVRNQAMLDGEWAELEGRRGQRKR